MTAKSPEQALGRKHATIMLPPQLQKRGFLEPPRYRNMISPFILNEIMGMIGEIVKTDPVSGCTWVRFDFKAKRSRGCTKLVIGFPTEYVVEVG